jgi:hypothetical protein
MVTPYGKAFVSRRAVSTFVMTLFLLPTAAYAQGAGMKCLQPTFCINFIGKDLIELVTEVESDSNFIVRVSELPALADSGNHPKSALPDSDIARVRNGRAVNVFSLTGFRLIKSEGRVLVRYTAVDTGRCPQWNSGSVVVQAMEKSHIDVDAGILFGLGVSGALKGQPEFAISQASKHTSWLSSFGEFRYTSLAALDTISTNLTQKQFFNPFAEGGGVLDVDLGLMIHPFYEEWEQEVYALIIGGGFRSFAKEGIKEAFDRPRGFIGLHMNILEYNTQDKDGGLQGATGYAEVGFAYDEFWRTDIDTGKGIEHTFYEPQRLFFEGQVDLIVGQDNVPISARLTTDIPTKNFLGGKAALNFGIVVGINPRKVAELLGGITKIFR